MDLRPITDLEFSQFQSMLSRIAGINVSPAKKPLVSGRLAKRLQHYGVATYGEYFAILSSDKQKNELQIAIDLLTTNETYFFREPKHFELLRERIIPSRRPGTLRVWSAACSSGEEPYSIAMTLADQIGASGWELLASDLSTRVLDKARSGHYAMERASHIPRDYLNRFCLKGIGSQDGTFLIDKQLRARINFTQINLNAPLPSVGEFDVIFLRNVMIYFSLETKRDVVSRLLRVLRPGGYFIIGHSESLNGVTEDLTVVMPSVYRKPEK